MPDTLRVLYVDDEIDLLDIGKLFLEESGDFTVTTALSAAEALRLLELEKFDAIISDYQMPGLDGIQFLVEVRTRFGPAPFILFTGKGREEVVIQAINNGVDFYLQKGGDPGAQFAELSHKIRQAALRNKAEALLRKSEEKYRQLIEHSNEAILVAQDGMLKLVNNRLIELLGYSEQELLSTQFHVFIHPNDRAMVVERYQKRLKCEEFPSRYPFRLNPKNGNILWVEISAVVIDWDGRPATLNFLTDITERKREEEALRMNENRLQMTQEIGHIGCWEYDIKTNQMWGSEEGCHLFGYPRMAGSFPIENFTSCITEPEAVLKAFNDLINEGKEYDLDVIINPKDGSAQRTLHSIGILEKDESGNPVKIKGINQDITESKRSEEALRESRNRFEVTLASLDDAVFMVDPKTRLISECNAAATIIFGYSREEMVGMATNFLHVDQAHVEQFGREAGATYDDPGYYSREFEMRRKDGHVFPSEHFVQPVRDPDGGILYVVSVVRDITERKRAEEALRQGELLMREVFNNANDAVFLLERAREGPGTYLLVNDKAVRMLGYSREELLKMSPRDIVPGDIAKKIMPDVIQKLLKEGHATFESAHRRKDGSTYPIEVSTHTFRYKGKDVDLSIVRDITDRKKIEDALRVSEKKYRGIFENAMLGIFQTTTDGRLIDANLAAARMFGYADPAEILSAGINVGLEIYANPDDRKSAIDHLQKTGELEIHELPVMKRDRSTFWASVTVRSVKEPDGSIARYEGTIMDVSGRKQAEEALRESEEKYRGIFDESIAAVYVFDNKKNFINTNQAGLDLIGYSREELLHMSIPDVDADPAVVLPAHQELLSGERLINYEHRLRRKDGKLITVLNNSRPLTDPHGNIIGMISTLIDITKRKLAEDTLITNQIRLAEAMDLAHMANWEFDVSTGIFTFDDRFYALYGTTARLEGGNQMPAEVYAKKFVHPDDQYIVADEVNKAILATDPGYMSLAEHRIIRRDGEIRNIVVRFGITKDKNGRTIRTHGANQDITGRKRAEEALRESEVRYRAVADFTYDWEYWIAPDGKFIYVSPSCERITGYRPEEFTLDPNLLVTITQADDRDKIIEHLANGHQLNTEPGALEFRIITRNGEERWIGHECQPVYSTNGGYLGRRGSNRDITERKEAEKILVATLKRTRDQQEVLGTISLSPFLLLGDVHGLSARLTEVSSGVLGVERVSVWLFNNNEDELRCMDLYEVLYDRHSHDGVLKRHEYENEFDALSMAKYIDADDPLTDPRTAGYVNGYLKPNRITSMLDAVIRVSGQNLGVLCFEHVNRPHHWESDEISFACQLADQIAITLLNRDRKQAAEALRESEERYRNVVEDQTEFICRFLPDGTHIFVNDAYCRYFGKKREEIIGHRFKPLIHPEDREIVARHLASITPEQPVKDIDQRIIMPDSSIRWQRWSDRAIFDSNGRVIEYQSVGRDITEQKELENEMKHHEQELMEFSTSLATANRKLNLLSSITRHDINNQLTVQMGYLSILEKKEPDTTHNEYFQKVSTAAKRISAMIQFTKEYEEIGVHAPRWQDCHTILDTVSKQAALGKVGVKNDLSVGAEVFADPLILKVFYNLIDNAVRYGGKITTIQFFVEDGGDDHVIVCEDDGEGIVAAEKEKIFERGFGKNTGLGLAIVREILDITGISIRETGEPGKGARFEMAVPKGAWRTAGKSA